MPSRIEAGHRPTKAGADTGFSEGGGGGGGGGQGGPLRGG